MTRRIAILFSGEGTNMQNLLATLHTKTFGDLTIEVVACITNNPHAQGIAKAQEFGVEVIVIDHTHYETREAFDTVLVQRIKNLEVSLVVMAGFMRIVTPTFTQAVRAINIHPSLLPRHKGAGALKRSFQSDDVDAGVSVHWVSCELDSGTIILQKGFLKSLTPNFETFQSRMRTLEHEIFPQAVIQALSAPL